MSTDSYTTFTNNTSYNSSDNWGSSTSTAEPLVSWIQQTLLPSTTQVRSSTTFQSLQSFLFVVCFLLVPWLIFLVAILGPKMSTEEESPVVETYVESGGTMLAKQDSNISDKEPEAKDEYDDVMDSSDMAPLHFNILRSPARLRGSGRPSNSRSSSFSRSRSTSPVPTQSHPRGDSSGDEKGGAGPNGISRSSSDHSLESSSQTSVTDKHGHQHFITEDMLTDRLGFEELPPSHVSPHVSCTTLPSVCERMSEESLDDCHAFTDVKVITRRMSWGSDRPGSTSGGSVQGSVGGGDNNSVLKTLEEEGDSSADESDDEKEVVNTGAAAETAENPNIRAAMTSPVRTKEEETKIMFEMLDLVSTNEERRRLLQEEQQVLVSLEKHKNESDT